MSAASVNQFATRALVGLAQVDAEAKANCYSDCRIVEFVAACR